ncbi:NAD(P)/FAD-dependent oxidoreductase [Metabacillus sp. RGM 3146]|uniref:NAD(P)/FAD-dependent oxidoreductase n=1 Tax=Metabacillus sp. RGM 3146 TaxID=3401092 RepID=UPI003B99DED1
MKKYIVIGAGILGASTAYHLSKKECDVLIIDRKDHGQATAAAAGIICPWISQRRNKAWYELAKSGAAYYPQLIKELEKDGEIETGYAKVGAISLHQDPEKINAMEERTRKRIPEAPEIGELKKLSPAEAKMLFPAIKDDLAALHVSGAARVDGRALRDSLLRAAQKNGAVLIYGDAALKYVGAQVTGVMVNQEFIPAQSVIVCAGAWASDLLKPLGIELKISCQKAQIVHLRLEGEKTDEWPVVMPPSDQYLLAFDSGRIVAGATHENTEVFDPRITAGGLAEVFQKALQTAPGLEESTFLEARVGFRPFTEGFLPVIGSFSGWEGLLFANGLGASGLTIGPYLGSELAKLANGEKLEIDLKKYKVQSY